MANVFDYLRWRGDLPFDVSPMCEIDALIFCELSYIFFDGIVPESAEDGTVTLSEAADIFFERNANQEIIKLGEIVPDEIVDLFRLAATTRRYADVEISNFINIVDDESVEQFSAVTFYPTEDSIFVAYRGTDDSITGWREDFRMAFLTPVPAQRRAEEYLNTASSDLDRKIFIGGHSKGGNLALWAALNASEETCSRIEKVYNFDGPGFLDNVWESAPYQRIADKISTIIPTGSIVGLLLKYDANYRVTKSTAKNYLYQHDALTWEVLGQEFVCDEDVAPEVKRVNDMVGRWVDSMEPKDREAFIEGFFDILCSTNAKTVTELAENRSAVIKAFSSIDPETKHALLSGVKFFVGEGRSSVTESIKALIKKKPEANETDATLEAIEESLPKEKPAEPIEKAIASKKQTKPVQLKTSQKQVPKRAVQKKRRKRSAVERMVKRSLMQARSYMPKKK